MHSLTLVSSSPWCAGIAFVLLFFCSFVLSLDPLLSHQPPRDVQDSSRAAQHSVAATAGGVVPSHALREASAVAGGGNGGGVGGGGGRGRGGRRFGPGGVGPQSGFGSDSEDGFSEVPSAFRP